MAEKNWETLEGACYYCKKCRLWETRNHVVIGKGNKNADIIFIGEGPGQQEDLTGIPFVGPAGQLLDKMLQSINLSVEDVYIANIVKCRPPGNRDPHEDEQEACLNYLRYQLKLTATFHPSALLRDESKKRPAWEDFKSIQSKLIELNKNEVEN